ncbi:hypothetical protein M0L20_29495 [Spirosoma sp. RP8]|uniref:DUF4861 domain-containing protein n=1 Tax=Spirosoma liriopis TaxID=2937440 RepID=A0ABT0HV04_9BACT|nr:hypothetical protein [Spirosoma liriopis]MCK8496037.1 hypothetical protein [Spirosoma liriopis]
MKILYVICFALLYLSLSISNAQIPNDTLPSHKLPPIEAIYTNILPTELTVKKLCETDSGRRILIKNLDSLTLLDIRYQWEGRRMQKEQDIPDTFNSYLEQLFELRCSGTPGWIFSFEPRMGFFYYTGTLGQPQRIGCASAGDGGNDDDCNLTVNLKLPSGWQVCKILYKQRQRRHGKLAITPAYWLEDDNSNNPKFGGYQLLFTGHGDRENASYFYLNDVRILALKANLSNNDRSMCGCDMPQKPKPVIANYPKPNSPPALAKMNLNLANKRENMIDLYISNAGNKTGRMYYRIDVVTDKGLEKRYIEGYADVDPNTVYHQTLHEWGAKGWKIVYRKAE